MNDILALERLTNAMWRAEEHISYDGWLLQFAGGYTRRPNSVSVLAPSTLPLAEKRRVCEQAYAARQQPTIFKLIPALGHHEVENMLASAGYVQDGMNLVQTMPLHQAYPNHAHAHSYPQCSPAWMQAFVRMKALTPAATESHTCILARIEHPAHYCQIMRDEEIVAVGLGVICEGWCGIFDVITDARWRGQGLATQMMLTLLNAARTSGATHALLQVSADNVAARRLYQQLGFTDAYTYTYRMLS